jgi:hypothetical protein
LLRHGPDDHLDAGGGEHGSGGGDLAGQRAVAVVVGDRPDLGQCLPGLDSHGSGSVTGPAPVGAPARRDDGGQPPTYRLPQVAGDTQPLSRHLQRGTGGPGRFQIPDQLTQAGHAEQQQPVGDRHDGGVGHARVDHAVPDIHDARLFERHPDREVAEHRDSRQRPGVPTAEGKKHGGDDERRRWIPAGAAHDVGRVRQQDLHAQEYAGVGSRQVAERELELHRADRHDGTGAQ